MFDTHFWVIGGKFGSMNFHSFVPGTQQIEGPFSTRREAETSWQCLSEKHRHEASVRFTITEEKVRVPALSALGG